MRALVIGANGMIGSAVFQVLTQKKDWEIFGTVRNPSSSNFLSDLIGKKVLAGVDLGDMDSVIRVLEKISPDVVINCAGLTKHKSGADDALFSIPVNSLAPHRLNRLCNLIDARFIHISTDCVFSGKKGNYTEDDLADARDTYGLSKILGEVSGPNSLTLRTSTIGHEIQTKYGLLEWFLMQEKCCKGFGGAVFSGLPSVVFAEVIRDIVIPNVRLTGLYHVASTPINKFDLLNLIAGIYKKIIMVELDDELVIDRSLNANRFHQVTGYTPPSWDEMIRIMHDSQRSSFV